MALMLKSPAFSDGERIPDRFVRDGQNLSPPLEWSGVPDGTRSLLFRHWAVYDIPPEKERLDEGAGRRDSDLKQGRQRFRQRNL